LYALIRARVHRGAAVEDVANVRHGDAPFVHPPVAVGSRSNLHGIMIGAGTPDGYPDPVVLLAEVPYLVRRGHPDVLPCARRKVVNHALEFRLSKPDEHTLQRVLRFPRCPHLIYLPFLIVHRAPLVVGRDTPKDAPTLSSRAQLLRTLLLGTSVDISSGGYHPSSSSFTARLVKK